MLTAEAVDVAAAGGDLERLQTRGASIMLRAVDERLASLIGVADPVKTTIAEAI